MVAEYKDKPIRGVGLPVFVIPWVVLQELDRLCKHSDKKFAGLVEKTLQFLKDAMGSNHPPRVVFQTYDEVFNILIKVLV